MKIQKGRIVIAKTNAIWGEYAKGEIGVCHNVGIDADCEVRYGIIFQKGLYDSFAEDQLSDNPAPDNCPLHITDGYCKQVEKFEFTTPEELRAAFTRGVFDAAFKGGDGKGPQMPDLTPLKSLAAPAFPRLN